MMEQASLFLGSAGDIEFCASLARLPLGGGYLYFGLSVEAYECSHLKVMDCTFHTDHNRGK